MNRSKGLAPRLQAIADVSISQSHEQKLLLNQRLFPRIRREFRAKVLIGDININDAEYDLLVEYMRAKCQHIIRARRPIDPDPVFATALVHFGIRNYDGNFWGHVSNLLETDIHPGQQRSIGESFITTLRYYNKKMMRGGKEWVNNILLHGFVSNHYAFALFEFLFKYYDLDLERDLERNTPEMMDTLMEIAQRDDNTGRTYLLVKQTANALKVNSKGARIRFHHLLKLIDQAYWEQVTPQQPESRLTKLFNKWVNQSEDFQLQFHRLSREGMAHRRKKHFSSPYLHCNLCTTDFVIKLPTQLIRADDAHSVKWRITIGKQEPFITDAYVYPAVTGFKTEEDEVPVTSDHLFEQVDIDLLRDGETIRSFRIREDCIRFFDSTGDFVQPDPYLPPQKLYSFTRRNELPVSNAMEDSETVKNLVRSYFEFEEGDIVRLPDNAVLSVGKQVEEGLMNKSRLPGVVCLYDEKEWPVFTRSPYILLKIDERKAKGTLIMMNNKRFRLFDAETVKIELNDRSGKTGYLIDLEKHGCSQDGRYQVYVDVPNDRTHRYWEFVLIKGFAYTFEGAPYLFRTRGTIKFPERFVLESQHVNLHKNIDENSFNFKINPYMDRLNFHYRTDGDELTLLFDVPALMWKFDNKSWQVEKPDNLWYTELPQFIYLRYPDSDIVFTLDEWDEYGQEQKLPFENTADRNHYVCDLTRVRSWLGREQKFRVVYFEIGNMKIEFLKIFTRSEMNSCILKGDFEEDILEGELQITGKADYYVDVRHSDTGEIVVEKLQLHKGRFVISCSLEYGHFQIDVYEAEEDDSGFGIMNYYLIGSVKQSVTDPYDLRGKTLKLRYVKKGVDNLFPMVFSASYVIRDLVWNKQGSGNIYEGKLYIESTNLQPINVKVEFPDLDQLHYAYLTFFDGYDDLEFLYDHQRRFIVRWEQPGLSRAVRYRRYESLYPEEYVYVLEFLE